MYDVGLRFFFFVLTCMRMLRIYNEDLSFFSAVLYTSLLPYSLYFYANFAVRQIQLKQFAFASSNVLFLFVCCTPNKVKLIAKSYHNVVIII